MRTITLTWSDGDWEKGIADQVISSILTDLESRRWVLPDRHSVYSDPLVSLCRFETEAIAKIINQSPVNFNGLARKWLHVGHMGQARKSAAAILDHLEIRD